MTSAVPFSCPHIAATGKPSEHLSAKILTPEDILAYKCDKAAEEKLWQHLDSPKDFRHSVKVSEHCFAIFTDPSTSKTQLGFVMLQSMPMENCNAVIRFATENHKVENKSRLTVFACTFMFCFV